MIAPSPSAASGESGVAVQPVASKQRDLVNKGVSPLYISSALHFFFNFAFNEGAIRPGIRALSTS